jgi:hypothetical protein
MWQTIAIIGALVLAWFLLTPVLGTIVTYRTLRVPFGWDFQPCHPDSLPEQWRPGAAGIVVALEREGFIGTGVYSEWPERSFHLELLEHPELPVSARVVLLTRAGRTSAYLQLTTKYPDGGSVTTVNSPLPGTFAVQPQRIMHRTESESVPEVLREHAAHLREHGGTPLGAPQHCDPATIAVEERSVIEYQIERHLLRPSGDGLTCRPTVRGATRSVFGIWWKTRFTGRRSHGPGNPGSVRVIPDVK